MPFVPIDQSAYTFNFTAQAGVGLTGALITADGVAETSFNLQMIEEPTEPPLFQVTVQSYEAGSELGDVGGAYFAFNSELPQELITNAFPDANPQTGFSPANMGGQARSIAYNGASGSEWTAVETFSFLIEVWEDEVPPVVACEEIGRVSRAYVSAHDRTRVHNTRLYPREKRCLVANFNGAIPAGRTIVTATWEMEVASSVSIASPSIAGRSAQVMIQACYRGMVCLRCQVVLDNGEIYNQLFVVQVLDGPYFGDEATATAPGPTQVSVSV